MSLSMNVYNPRTKEYLEISWLRNPYGLCRWAQDNYLFAAETSPADECSLDYVCNTWSYKQSAFVDRKRFLDVVRNYARVLLDLDRGFFFFSEEEVKVFLEPHTLDISAITTFRCNGRLGIDQKHFSNPCFSLNFISDDTRHTLEHYQQWYVRLISMARMLQNPETEFYCSN